MNRQDRQERQSEVFEAELWADLALQFMQQNKEHPWLLVVMMGPPYNPYQAPSKDSREMNMEGSRLFHTLEKWRAEPTTLENFEDRYPNLIAITRTHATGILGRQIGPI